MLRSCTTRPGRMRISRLPFPARRLSVATRIPHARPSLTTLRNTILLATAALAAAAFLAPASSAAELRRPKVSWLKGEGNFTKSHRGAEVDRLRRRPRHRRAVLGLGELAPQRALARVVALRRLAQGPHRPARPRLRHRLARRQLEDQREVGRGRARGLRRRPRRLYRGPVPRLRAARRVHREARADADRPAPRHRPRRGAEPVRPDEARRRRRPHRSRLDAGTGPRT